ncbi:MAG TPA: sigma-54 dependent transcriptional regulator [Saprospiraceae bacterium]|nr:sigma-54 dependent transcriptional regulator [Saprospiraceae bacterium]
MENLQVVKQRFGIIGQSPLLDRALDTAVRVASTDLSVLIAGESGVGKEIFSKIIHGLSARKHNKFIAINCGAIPEGTINSELFGHEKGAFTGATSDRKGYFETYDEGTIFLDEIGEMPLDTQTYLLRILENGEFIKVGSNKVQKTDVRIVAATNVDLQERIQKGKFREDLYFRLNTITINVPPLRERGQDIYMLFRRFAVDFAEKYRSAPVQLGEKARLLLENYNWPGNIRELKNVAEKVSVLSEKRQITADDLVKIVPNILKRNLPAIRNEKDSNSFQEREILYKLLFEMKNDLNDLKSLVFELIQSNDLRVPDLNSLKALEAPEPANQAAYFNKGNRPGFESYTRPEPTPEEDHTPEDRVMPLILSEKEKRAQEEEYESVEFIDENLSLEFHEKNLIQKALKKHNDRRRDAANELGISERTLYRKIKQYNL